MTNLQHVLVSDPIDLTAIDEDQAEREIRRLFFQGFTLFRLKPKKLIYFLKLIG